MALLQVYLHAKKTLSTHHEGQGTLAAYELVDYKFWKELVNAIITKQKEVMTRVTSLNKK